MNGIHDMGGMHGLGSVEPEEKEPVFHDAWEGRMYGMAQSMTRPSDWTIDYSRFTRECMGAAAYLQKSYYEHWYETYATMLLAAGIVSEEELRSGRAAPGSARRDDAMTPDKVWSAIHRGLEVRREIAEPPRFAVGDAVRTANSHPTGHTRLPRYARDKPGVIHAHHDAHVLPDSNAHGKGESPQYLYSVAIPARALWGPQAAPKDKVYLDLWDSYLEPA